MIEYLGSMHDRLVITISLVFGVLAVVYGANYLLRRTPGRIADALLRIGQLLMVAQVVIGVILFALGQRPADPTLHLIYAVVAVVGLPAAYLYTRERGERTTTLVIALTCVFLVGVALRALETGRGTP